MMRPTLPLIFQSLPVMKLDRRIGIDRCPAVEFAQEKGAGDFFERGILKRDCFAQHLPRIDQFRGGHFSDQGDVKHCALLHVVAENDLAN